MKHYRKLLFKVIVSLAVIYVGIVLIVHFVNSVKLSRGYIIGISIFPCVLLLATIGLLFSDQISKCIRSRQESQHSHENTTIESVLNDTMKMLLISKNELVEMLGNQRDSVSNIKQKIEGQSNCQYKGIKKQIVCLEKSQQGYADYLEQYIELVRYNMASEVDLIKSYSAQQQKLSPDHIYVQVNEHVKQENELFTKLAEKERQRKKIEKRVKYQIRMLSKEEGIIENFEMYMRCNDTHIKQCLNRWGTEVVRCSINISELMFSVYTQGGIGPLLDGQMRRREIFNKFIENETEISTHQLQGESSNVGTSFYMLQSSDEDAKPSTNFNLSDHKALSHELERISAIENELIEEIEDDEDELYDRIQYLYEDLEKKQDMCNSVLNHKSVSSISPKLKNMLLELQKLIEKNSLYLKDYYKCFAAYIKDSKEYCLGSEFDEDVFNQSYRNRNYISSFLGHRVSGVIDQINEIIEGIEKGIRHIKTLEMRDFVIQCNKLLDAYYVDSVVSWDDELDDFFEHQKDSIIKLKDCILEKRNIVAKLQRAAEDTANVTVVSQGIQSIN